MKSLKSLERFRGMFFLSGLILALSAAIWAFGLRVQYGPVKIQSASKPITEEEEEIIYTLVERPKPVETTKSQPVSPELPPIITPDPVLPGTTSTPNPVNPVDTTTAVKKVEMPLEDEVPIFITNVEKKPVFPGCENLQTEEERFECFNNEIRKFIGRHVQYKTIWKELGLEGKVFIRFVVDRQGEITDVEVRRGVHNDLDQEALKTISKLPKMTPAKQNGRAVNVEYIVPVNFKLNR